MKHTQAPIKLWCFCCDYKAELLSLSATGRFDLKGRTPYEVVTNYTPDISEYKTFSWTQWRWCIDEDRRCKRLFHWLGPSLSFGKSLFWYVLIENGEFIARSSVIAVDPLEIKIDNIVKSTDNFTQSVEGKIGNHRQPIYDLVAPDRIYFAAFGDQPDEDDRLLPYGEEIMDQKTMDIDDSYLKQLDAYIGAKLVVPGQDSVPVLPTIFKRKRYSQGLAVGKVNTKPILDSRMYEFEYP